MKDLKNICPECGAMTQPASGCRFCPQCGWGKCHKYKDIMHTLASFVMLVAFLTLMGWSVVEDYDRTPTPQLVDKQMLKLYTSQNLAEHTYRLNQYFDARSR